MANPYETCIKLTADVSGVSSALAIATASLTRLGTDVNKLQKGFENLRPAILGAAGAAGGFAALKIVEGVEKAGETLKHAKVMFEAALPVQERASAMAMINAKAVEEAGKNMRTTLAGNVAAIHDLYNVVQDPKHATELLAPFNILKNMLESVKGTIADVGGAAEGKEVASAIRAFELSGRTNAETIAKAAQMYANSTIALRGRVTGGQLFTQVQYAGMARQGWDDEFLTQGVPALIAMGLGTRTGRALNQIFNNLVMGGGGALASRQQALAQEKWFLHTPEDENKTASPMHIGKHLGMGSFGRQDQFRGFKPGTVFESELLGKNPIAWSTDYLELLKSKGVDTQDNSTMMRIVGEIARNNMQLQAGLGELLLPNTHRQLIKELINMAKVDPNAAAMVNEKDPLAIHAAIAAQWENVKESLGENLVDPFMDNILKPMTMLFSGISQWAERNPEAVKDWGIAIAGLGAAMVGLGSATLIATFLPGGQFIVALGAIGAALAALAMINPGAAGTLLSNISTDIKLFIDGLKGMIPQISNWRSWLPFGDESTQIEKGGLDEINRWMNGGQKALPTPTPPIEGGADNILPSPFGSLPPIFRGGPSGHGGPISGSIDQLIGGEGLAERAFGGGSGDTMKFIRELAHEIAKAFGDYFGLMPGGGLGGIGVGGGGMFGGGYSGGSGAARGQRSILHGGHVAMSAYGGGQLGFGPYNVKNAYDLIKKVGGTDAEARMLAAIAQPESRGRPGAHNYNPRTGDDSYGLWQINMLGRMGPERRAKFGLSSNEALYDPMTNARVALAMERAAHGYRDWSTYKSGAYRPYLPRGPMGDGGAGDNASTGAGGRAHGGILPAGQVVPGLKELEEATRNLPGMRARISSENDAFHHRLGYKSAHVMGLAFDQTLRNASQHANAAESIRNVLRGRGLSDKDFKVIDEYAHPSRAATGGHIHTQFNSAEAAERFRQAIPGGVGGGRVDGSIDKALEYANSMVGQQKGAPGLQNYFKQSGIHINSAVTAWCAGFINATLKHAGIPGTDSLSASSFASWGHNAAGEGFQAGDLIGHNKGWAGNKWGHTMMATGKMIGNMVEVIAGDHNDAVSKYLIDPLKEQWHRRGGHDAIGAPPQRGQHESRSHVYLDGRVVGELIERHITRRHAHTSGPGGHDGRRGLTPVDSWSVA